MNVTVGIRREDKNRWERRVPLIPEDVAYLTRKKGFKIAVQPSAIRAYPDQNYLDAGAEIREDLTDCAVILGVKEITPPRLQPERIYLFFSHTIKGQNYNMPMLRRLIEGRSTLIDYECIRDRHGSRLVFFGRHAGLAGMIDSLYAMGQRAAHFGWSTPFCQLKPTMEYDSLDQARSDLRRIGGLIREGGVPRQLAPLVCGIAGYGHVSRGAQEILDLLPVRRVKPEQLATLPADRTDCIYKVVFQEKDMVRLRENPVPFELKHYFDSPEQYEGVFSKYLPHLTLLINAIYWDDRYPRLVTWQWLEKSQRGRPRKLLVIGDLSCDINGAVECTVKATEPDSAVYCVDPLNRRVSDGYGGEGILILAVDNLPAEIPREASESFSATLRPFLPPLLHADFQVPFPALRLPAELKKAVIVYRGRLTPDYVYLAEKLLQGEKSSSKKPKGDL